MGQHDGKQVTHIRSKLNINALDHQQSLPRNELPPDIAQILR